MAQLHSRFYRRQLAAEDERKIARIIGETGCDYETAAKQTGVKLRSQSADGHNRDRARGLPIVGRASGGGASPGTDPVQALLAKERRGG